MIESVRPATKSKARRGFPGGKLDLSDLRSKKPISGKPEIGAHFANFNLPSALISRVVSRGMLGCGCAALVPESNDADWHRRSGRTRGNRL